MLNVPLSTSGELLNSMEPSLLAKALRLMASASLRRPNSLSRRRDIVASPAKRKSVSLRSFVAVS